MKTTDIFPADYFKRDDEANDAEFYTMPRLVVHIDDPAIEALTDCYADTLPKNGAILDLMSSWRSHLPLETLTPTRVVGLGLNAEEMLNNPAITDGDLWVHNLNENPVLPFADEEFDAVICAVSVQYLIQPIEVFAEVFRILKPGGRFVVSYANRCFPQKATAVWLSTTDAQHAQIVVSYFQNSAEWGEVAARIKSAETGAPADEDPLFILWAEKPNV
ncbi:MAG: class I SAM-dependent methyltransferase [Anaerolineae bacterium]